MYDNRCSSIVNNGRVESLASIGRPYPNGLVVRWHPASGRYLSVDATLNENIFRVRFSSSIGKHIQITTQNRAQLRNLNRLSVSLISFTIYVSNPGIQWTLYYDNLIPNYQIQSLRQFHSLGSNDRPCEQVRVNIAHGMILNSSR